MQSLRQTTFRVVVRQRPHSWKSSKPFICPSCRSTWTTPPTNPLRTFTSTRPTKKKSASNPKSSRKTPSVPPPEVSQHIPNNAKQAKRDAEIDPYDYTTLQTGIDTAISRLRQALKKTHSAGRVAPENLESLPVELNVKNPDAQGQHAHKEHTRLGDIASVVPKGGRTLQIFASDETHIKPLLAAVRASEYSLAPEAPSSHAGGNPLLITVPIPPVTQETRQQAASEAKKCLEKANGEIRQARGEAQKQFRRMEIEKLVIVDEIRKAHKGMEEVVKKGNAKAKEVVDQAVRGILGS